jgi:hypothetical protein
MYIDLLKWEMLNWPKIVKAVSTKVLLQFFPTVCPLPHSFFSTKKMGDNWACFALVTFHVMNVPKGT